MGTNAVNAVKNIGTNTMNVINNAANSFTNVAKNASKNLGISPAMNNLAKNVPKNLGMEPAVNAVANTGKNIANSLKALNTSVSIPVEESIQAVPSDGISLGVSLPLILGIGVLVIMLTLFVVFRQQIANALQSSWDYVKGKMGGSTATAAPSGPEVTMESQPKTVPLPPVAVTESVINKVIPSRKTVFNVATNKYTYADAEPLCKALGAELATYDQVKQAWDDGADWCNYGWVKGQTAVYPTQQKTFEKLQTASTDDEKMACGLPGVNGGYMDNPELRFGVNCYGERPPVKDADITYKNMMGDVPLTNEVLEQRKKELRFRSEANQIPLNPFS